MYLILKTRTKVLKESEGRDKGYVASHPGNQAKGV